jgi:hypothetical protein
LLAEFEYLADDDSPLSLAMRALRKIACSVDFISLAPA